MEEVKYKRPNFIEMFEKMVFESGRLSVMTSTAKDAGNQKAAKRMEKVSSVLSHMIDELRDKISKDDLLTILERMDFKKSFEEVSKDIKTNIAEMEKNFAEISEFLKTQ